ncbi:hypothetical protein AM587_10006276 [Phytophthora nicotianae]|uniref:Uncharacterized protein n=1 Tax=Phytophthora nicotianae TaxID=4792 RepID=A0A0W8CBD4_PHYNI|nr:hypothetical protein AM587_10006276 [Phytophthora nicotianae]
MVDEEEEVEGTPAEINQLIGKPVEKTVTKEGCGMDVVQGAVASYFPATKMFRVMYFDGECSDLTYQEVFNSIPADLRPVVGEKRKRKTDETPRNGEKDSTPSAPSASPKRLKTLDLNAKDMAPTKRSSPPSSPVHSVVRESDMMTINNVEFNIARKVLFIIVSTVNNAVMNAQLEVLSSADLKVLAVLPGITRDAIIDSKIGKKIRVIEKRGTYRDSSIPDLASWVIKKMKADVGIQNETQVPSTTLNEKSAGDSGNRGRGSNSPRRSTPSPRDDEKHDDRPSIPKSTDSPRPNKAKTSSTSNGSAPAVKRSNSVNHLHNLMNSRNGRDTSTARRDRDIFGNLVTPQNKRRLGTSHNWRARRSTVVLDQVTKRVTEKTQEFETIKTKKVEDDDWQPSKIKFAEKESVCPFEKEVEVSKLLVFRPAGSTKAQERPPVKRHTGPLRSILRVRLPSRPTQENAPQPNAEDSTSAPPTVHASGRPTIDPIVVPSERPSLTSEVSEDGAVESPVFDTSKLSKVVSPTEKRKQGFSPPPCIPTSEQPPLDFTEEGGEDEVSGDRRFEAALEESEQPKPAEGEEGEISDDGVNADGKLEASVEKFESNSPQEAATVVVMSPIVSEDEASEDGEVSSSDAAAGKLEPEASSSPSLSTGSKDGDASDMKSAVQQAATISA